MLPNCLEDTGNHLSAAGRVEAGRARRRKSDGAAKTLFGFSLKEESVLRSECRRYTRSMQIRPSTLCLCAEFISARLFVFMSSF